MESIKPTKVIKVYQLVKQNGISFTPIGATASYNMGTGFYSTLHEAELNRTAELLKTNSSNTVKDKFHIFELDVPNPAYVEE